MVNEYKKIVLLNGLELINDYQFNAIKSLLANDLQLTKKMRDEYNRIQIADKMEEIFPGAACVDKLIELFKDMPQLKGTVKKIKSEKAKVTRKIKAKEMIRMKKGRQEEADSATPTPTARKALTSKSVEETSGGQKRKNTNKGTSGIKRNKVSQERNQRPCPSGASTSATIHMPQIQTASSTPSSTSLPENQRPQAKRQRTTKRKVPTKEPIVVMVLKATELFEFESPEKSKSMMFHATVATENKFFRVKVFDTSLKEKFTPKKFIVIKDYFECKGVLEINEASSVSEAGHNQKIEVPTRIIKRANETPKIDNLQKQASGTFVYGLFTLHKKKVNKKNTIYEIQDNTGKMDVVGNGKWHNLRCVKGDKLRLYCFQLRTVDYKLKLACGTHSFIKVTKIKKNKKGPTGVYLDLQIEVANNPPNQLDGVNSNSSDVGPMYIG